MRISILSFMVILRITGYAFAENTGWYTEGDFAPETRIKLTVTNTLN